MRILICGGTFDRDGGRPSGVVGKMSKWLDRHTYTLVTTRNGGNVSELSEILEDCKGKSIVFWMPSVSNDEDKIRDVKKIAPRTLLVSSKRNDDGKYSFQELVNRSLGAKANLTIEFSRQSDGKYRMMVFDPLGTCWYDGDDVDEMMKATYSRLRFLGSITREGATRLEVADEKSVLSDIYSRRRDDMEKFVEIVKEYAATFHRLVNPEEGVDRFLGNASTRGCFENFRCTKGGFPSFRDGNYIMMSRRNVNKETLSAEDFVPTFRDEDEHLSYLGEAKPSVDSPIQLRLYEQLPHVNYMIHSHCYIEGAPFTSRPVPCGAIEETQEIMDVVWSMNPELDAGVYFVNLVGHGSIAMSRDIDGLESIDYVRRELPEKL